MNQVSKEEFKKIFLEYGKASDGWGKDYWEKMYENPKRENMKYLVRLPETEGKNRMMVVDDYSVNEYRLFFVSVDEEENLYR
ncbi:hypothetical protein [Pseudocolwellia sp. HL-MZ7]|uniref:hypothetical protein n=1 Tax=Pseudocolwellia sp. HL-MZ7 TaxID=3400627 RepID=UPI003CF4635A